MLACQILFMSYFLDNWIAMNIKGLCMLIYAHEFLMHDHVLSKTFIRFQEVAAYTC